MKCGPSNAHLTFAHILVQHSIQHRFKCFQGARDFVLSAYQELKKANPKFPILVRESSNAEARLLARYDFGVEEAVSVEGLDKASISKKLEELVKKGESMPR